MVLLVDEDVPRNDTRVQLLHWLQPNLVSQNGSLNLTVDVTATGASPAVGAPYLPPTPPGGSGAHRYTFLLYEQPDMWMFPTNYSQLNPPSDSSARSPFNVSDFVTAAGLGQVIGANFLRVLNGTAQETSSVASATGTAAPAGSASATATGTTSSGASGSSSAATPSATGSSASDLVEASGSFRNLIVGVALAVVGATAWML